MSAERRIERRKKYEKGKRTAILSTYAVILYFEAIFFSCEFSFFEFGFCCKFVLHNKNYT